MSEVTATAVNELRRRTQAGMMDCKKALVEANGDMDAAIDILRRKGVDTAGRLITSREANEGIVKTDVSLDRREAAIIELRCETDFVARNEGFIDLAERILNRLIINTTFDVDMTRDFSATVGEKVEVQKYFTARNLYTAASWYAYTHSNGRIGVLVEMTGGDAELGQDVAMHIAAVAPLYVSRADVPKDVVEKEREFLLTQPDLQSKPEAVRPKMVEGRLNKFYSRICLLDQLFVKDSAFKMESLLALKGAQVHQFVRYEIGK